MKQNIDWDGAIKAYYVDNKSVASIVELFELPVTKTIYKSFPPYICTDLQCEFCKTTLESVFVNKVTSKSHPSFIFNVKEQPVIPVEHADTYNGFMYQPRITVDDKAMLTDEGYIVALPKCPQCNHIPNKYCDCENCQNIKGKNKDYVISKTIEEFKADQVEQPDHEALNSETVFIVLYALTYGMSDDKKSINFSILSSDQKDILLNSGLFLVDLNLIENSIQMKSVYEFEFDENRISYKINSVDQTLSLSNAHRTFKKIAGKHALNKEAFLDVVELWSKLALQEAMDFMEYYCDIFGLTYRPGEKTISAVQKSLNRYGLAQTARYIYNAVKRAHTQGKEEGVSGRQSFNKIYGCLCFWIDDQRARSYKADPFNRGSTVLSEPKSAIVFSHAFLEQHDINYFSSPINIKASSIIVNAEF